MALIKQLLFLLMLCFACRPIAGAPPHGDTHPAVDLVAEDSSARPPNILVFVADDAGWKDFGAYGNEVVHTPSIDALARSGIRFNHAVLTSSQCSPSRISMLTGKYPHQTGAEDLHMPIPKGQTFVTTLLHDAGYVTGHNSKTHFGPNGDAQFDWYSPALEDFSQFLDFSADRSFFFWVGFNDPHRPYYRDSVTTWHQPNAVSVPAHLVDTQETRADLADYYDEISRMDSVIGSYMDELEQRRLVEKTVVVFLSDNGAPFPREKGTLYDAGVRTPLIVAWPDSVAPGFVVNDLVSSIDLAPTFLDLAGLPADNAMAGSSLVPAMFFQKKPTREFAFSERNWHNCDEHMRSVTSQRYKLIENAYVELPHCSPSDITRSPSWQALADRRDADTLTPVQRLLFQVPRARYELYDLELDPNEYRNVAGNPDYAQVLNDLVNELERWKAATNDFPPERRRRGDNTDRVTGAKFTQSIPEMIE